MISKLSIKVGEKTIQQDIKMERKNHKGTHRPAKKNLYLLFGGRTLAGTSDDNLTASTAVDS